jgi:glucose/arabinose dehydrogenase
VCGIAFITSDAFKSWKGNLLATGLAAQKLYRLVLEDNKVKQQSVLLENSGRVRNVVQGANGKVYVSLEGPGRIVEISAQ